MVSVFAYAAEFARVAFWLLLFAGRFCVEFAYAVT
jgi:hypothetical protein